MIRDFILRLALGVSCALMALVFILFVNVVAIDVFDYGSVWLLTDGGVLAMALSACIAAMVVGR